MEIGRGEENGTRPKYEEKRSKIENQMTGSDSKKEKRKNNEDEKYNTVGRMKGLAEPATREKI